MFWKHGITKSVTFRLTLWYALSMMVFFGVTSGFLYYRLSRQLLKLADRILKVEVAEARPALERMKPEGKALRQLLDDVAKKNRLHRISSRVLDSQGRLVAASSHFPAPSSRLAPEAWNRIQHTGVYDYTFRVEGAGHPFRSMCVPVCIGQKGGYVLEIAMYTKHIARARENFLANVAISVPILLCLSLGVGWAIAKRGLKPVASISGQARRISAANLQERIPQSGLGDELDGLAATLNVMLERLQEAFQRMAQFNADVSHELRTPLASLKTSAEVLLSGRRSEEEYRQGLEEALEQYDRLMRMCNSLLVLARADRPSGSPDAVPFDLAAVLNELCDLFEPVAESKGLGLSRDVATGVYTAGDRAALRHAFSNLIDNAIKYTDSPGQVTVGCGPLDQDRIRACVADTGMGIPVCMRERAFDPFFRLDSSRSRETGGVGLGLSLCRRLVEIHNGKVWIEGEPGKGTTVVVELAAAKRS